MHPLGERGEEVKVEIQLRNDEVVKEDPFQGQLTESPARTPTPLGSKGKVGTDEAHQLRLLHQERVVLG